PTYCCSELGSHCQFSILMIQRINSSVCTTVKEVAYTNNRIWDTAEYTIPMQASCLPLIYLVAFLTCLCPTTQSKHSCLLKEIPAFFFISEDFTVLIKNNIHFPKFNYTVLNISPNLNTSYTYNNITSPLCPIFHPGDILQEAKENFSEVAVKGGIIYGFRCPDDKKIKPGFHFNSAVRLRPAKQFPRRLLEEDSGVVLRMFSVRLTAGVKMPRTGLPKVCYLLSIKIPVCSKIILLQFS
uniref:Uncharacterized protein n=1 Tax=Buteo japonicus TaxID=224669 RepID=A0A8C0B0Z9_9AVES